MERNVPKHNHESSNPQKAIGISANYGGKYENALKICYDGFSHCSLKVSLYSETMSKMVSSFLLELSNYFVQQN